MKRVKRKIDFKDVRGSIMDVFVKEPYEHCVIIYSNKGAVRGNHFHKLSQQSDFMLFGKMVAYSRKQGSKKIEKTVISQNDFTTWDKGEAHEFIALEKCAFLSFVNGPRGGDKYESDTHRLKIPLHEQLKKNITDWTLLEPGKFKQSMIK
ncbi:MAG: cupin 2 conserved barrel domain protein [Parcubacteria group bacterium Gr01-1014_13]|nr:MAG: cupin 2 conserved barrel domain protein [Parcubacteria group bacterium Gr01-1014_13]